MSLVLAALLLVAQDPAEQLRRQELALRLEDLARDGKLEAFSRAVQREMRSRKRICLERRSANGMSSASAIARAVPSMSRGEIRSAEPLASADTPAVSETTSTPGSSATTAHSFATRFMPS